MKFSPIFSVGVGSVIREDLLGDVKKLFDGRVQLLPSPDGGIMTSLKGYDVKTSSMDKLLVYEESQKLIEAIKQEAAKYLINQGANVEYYSLHVSNMWLNEMTSNTKSPAHYHYGHTLSGCYYVEVPYNSSGITFINPLSMIPKQTIIHKQLTAYNAGDCVFYPVEGEMFFWESYLQHEVKQSEFDGVRRSVAFDVIIKQEIFD